MAARTAGCGTRECSHRLRDQVVAVQIVEIDRSGLVSAVVKDSGRQESKSNSQVWSLREEVIRSQLFANELRPRFV